jgi:hypothetical protein
LFYICSTRKSRVKLPDSVSWRVGFDSYPQFLFYTVLVPTIRKELFSARGPRSLRRSGIVDSRFLRRTSRRWSSENYCGSTVHVAEWGAGHTTASETLERRGGPFATPKEHTCHRRATIAMVACRQNQSNHESCLAKVSTSASRMLPATLAAVLKEIRAYSAVEWELFIEEWLRGLRRRYVSVKCTPSEHFGH